MSDHAVPTKKEEFKSESSIFAHPIHYTKAKHTTFPTWLLLVVLFIAFFALKSFIYISDKKRHGK